MGWFNKKEKKVEKKETPLLPELPKLPEFPKIEKKQMPDLTTPIHQLPSFPTNSFGKKFSQNAIKDAVTGKKEGEEVWEANEFVPEKNQIQMMQKPLTKELHQEKNFKKTPYGFEEAAMKVKRNEPIFIRIDKFEEGLKIFEKTKEKILEIEGVLSHVQKIKDEEEKQLKFWENEIQMIKKQIEKVDKDIFSQI